MTTINGLNLFKLEPSVHWKDAYAEVERAVRVLLTGTEGTLSTTELAEKLLETATRSADQPVGEATTMVRKRLYKALGVLPAYGLKDCCTAGEIVQRKFGAIRPWIWHAPKPDTRPRCFNCGQPMDLPK